MNNKEFTNHSKSIINLGIAGIVMTIIMSVFDQTAIAVILGIVSTILSAFGFFSEELTRKSG